MRASVVLLAVPLVVGSACDGCESEPWCRTTLSHRSCEPHAACEPIVRAPIDPAGQVHRFVIDSVHLATGTCDDYAHMIGFNLDADPQCRPDNAAGQVLSTVMSWLDTDLNETLAELIADGRILHLLELRATSLDNADGASVSIHVGSDTDGDPADNFSGTETFGIDATFASEAMAGAVRAGTLEAAVGVVPLQIALPGVDEPSVLSLEAAMAEVVVDPGGQRAHGRIGGALPGQKVYHELLPIVWMALARIVETDCPGGSCARDTRGEQIVNLMDDCDEGSTTCDGYLGLDEFRDNSLVQALSAADVDILDEWGRYNPLCDKIRDALSVAVSFTAVRANF
jgi:hypothetical protein